MHAKVQGNVLKRIITVGVLFGLMSAGFVAAPSGSAVAEARPSITSCVITDGSTSQSVWPLNIPSDAISIPGAKVRMVPTPSSGHIVYATVGFAKKDGSEWAHLGGGTGLATDQGYQPPGYVYDGDPRDAGSSTMAQYASYSQYPPSEWNFEYRYYAWQENLAVEGRLVDFTVEPLCKITVGATDPVVSGQYAVTIPEGSTAVENYTASRPIASWSVTDYFGGDPLFQIPSGELSFRAPSNPFPFAGTDPFVYQAPITATDENGNQFGGTVSISFLIGSQIPPVISGPNSASITSPDTPVGSFTADETVTWSVTGGAHQSLFQINSSGALSFSNASAAGTYTVIITATDTDGNTTTKTITVTVNAAGGGDGGESPSSPNYSENSKYFVVEGFAKRKALLSRPMERFIESQLALVPSERRAICTGTVRGQKWNAKREALAFSRAKAGCDYITKLSPGLHVELKKRLISKKKQNSLTVRIRVFY